MTTPDPDQQSIHGSRSFFLPSDDFSPVEPDPLAAHLSPGDTIGGFRLIRLIGRGGMGAVWEAEELALQRRVALKLIRPERVDDMAIAMFQREARAGGRLSHPGLVSIYSYGDADGIHYIAQELVGNGHNLANVLAELREHDTLPEGYYREVAEFIIAVAEAMQAAHNAGVIHRDLKPQNILIDDEGRPRITDFGLARITGEESLSGRYGVLGTYYYMSPEQAAAKSTKIDHRADQFSLGVILYEMLTLKRPFDGDTEQQVLAHVLWDDPPAPRKLRSRVPLDLSVICMKGIEKNREHRFHSMEHLTEDLRRHLRDEPISAQPPSGWIRAKKWMLRHPTRSSVLGLGVVALVVISVLLVRTLRAEDDAWQSAELARAREQEAVEARRKEEEQRRAAEEAQEAAERAREKEAVERARADAERRNVLRLADVKILRDLEARADDLWPAHPELVPELEAWLHVADELIGNHDVHRASLAEVRSRSPSSAEIRDPAEVVFDDPQDAWWYETLYGLVQDLTALANADADQSLLASVRGRLERSKTIEQRSILDYEEDWEDAVFFLSESETYGHLEMKAQMGLVPLGEDPTSGLWEFWVIESGERPDRDPETGRWVIRGETGIVLVLLPGGTFTMGASPERAGPNFDPQADPDEIPMQVTLAPFFLSKYELSQGQYRRVMGENPSFYGADHFWTQDDWARHPVEHVSWPMGREAVRRLGLALPTEAQWEYGARGGTATPWWTGSDEKELARAANLADRSYAEGFVDPVQSHEWADGFAAHAPVGSFAANAFGLYDVHGNVWEWCQDMYEGRPPLPTHPHGLRADDGPDSTCLRVYRGGGFDLSANYARSTRRGRKAPTFQVTALGVRPAARVRD